ncbi:MAG: hypothetical protein VKK59_07065 [Vampirovibrionales bacterium]|nr:hypothetical protein [Vampirovibrionales bacterium]
MQASITDVSRLQQLLDEVEAELSTLTPKIEALEAQLTELQALRATRQRLLTLKLSLSPLLARDASAGLDVVANGFGVSSPAMPLVIPAALSVGGLASRPGTFLPDEAMARVTEILKRPGSLNYELYRAIVLAGGRASTEQIRQYLIEHNIARPHQGDAFVDVSLSDISSRVNYLVRKGAVQSVGNGVFQTVFGWV